MRSPNSRATGESTGICRLRLDFAAWSPRGFAAVLPRGTVQRLAEGGDFVCGQDVRDLDQHHCLGGIGRDLRPCRGQNRFDRLSVKTRPASGTARLLPKAEA